MQTSVSPSVALGNVAPWFRRRHAGSTVITVDPAGSRRTVTTRLRHDIVGFKGMTRRGLVMGCSHRYRYRCGRGYIRLRTTAADLPYSGHGTIADARQLSPKHPWLERTFVTGRGSKRYWVRRLWPDGCRVLLLRRRSPEAGVLHSPLLRGRSLSEPCPYRFSDAPAVGALEQRRDKQPPLPRVLLQWPPAYTRRRAAPVLETMHRKPVSGPQYPLAVAQLLRGGYTEPRLLRPKALATGAAP